MKNTIGIDIGAKRIAVVVLRGRKVIKKTMIDTPSSLQLLIKILKNTVLKLIPDLEKQNIQGIGIGVASPIDFKRGLILTAPNCPQFRNLALAKIIEKELKIKTKMDNDANCFVLAENILGAGRGVKGLLGITLGTGIGGGIVLDERIYHGAHGSAGEIGHIIVVEGGRKCGCGSRGCLEQYASAQAIRRMTKGIRVRDAAKRARNGEKRFIKIFEQVGHYLGIGLINIINIWDPEMIVIGGGVAHNWELISPSLRREIRKVISPLARKIKIKKAELKEDWAGAIGAALLLKYD